MFLLKTELCDNNMFSLKTEVYGKRPVKDNSKELYSLKVHYAKENSKEGLELNPDVWREYTNLDNEESTQQLIDLLKTGLTPPSDYPLIHFQIDVDTIPKEQFRPTTSDQPRRITEKIYEEGNIKEDYVYQLNPKSFVRELYLCDIIKGWDYEPFFKEE